MKKLLAIMFLWICMAAVCLLAYAESTDGWTQVADFSFDDNYTDGGTAAGSILAGDPQAGQNHGGKNGVLYLDGNDALKVTAKDDSSLLTGAVEVWVSFDSYCQNNSDTTNGWPFYAAPSSANQTYLGENYLGVYMKNISVSAERYYQNREAAHSGSVGANNLQNGAWHHVEVIYTLDGIRMYVDDRAVMTSTSNASIAGILGDNSVLYIGKANWDNGEYYRGYIDNFKVYVKKGTSVTLNPFNNRGTDANTRPNLYDNLSLREQGSQANLERIVASIPSVNNSTTFTLPTFEQMLDGFKLHNDGSTYTLSNTQNMQYAQKLVGWYDIKTGNYYDVSSQPQTVTLTGSGHVFYADWVAADYDFMPETNGDVDTTNTIATVDTSSFVKINVFDYTDLVNVNAANVTSSGNLSESWTATQNRTDGHLAFFDTSNYSSNGDNKHYNLGNMGNCWGDDGYNVKNITYNIIQKNPTLISHLFSPDSDTLGVKHVGEGNYLFSYDPATGMYSYDSSKNGAVYQQSEKRFYVYDKPRYFKQNVSCFFPLNEYDTQIANNNGTINYWFGMSAEVSFWLPDDSGTSGNKITDANGQQQDMIFSFTGDDDLWVLIDGEVVLDIGGVHDTLSGTINFSTGEVTVNSDNKGDHPKSFKFSAGNHTMQICYMERGGNESNCQIQFNLLPQWEAEEPGLDVVSVKKHWAETAGIKLPISVDVEVYDVNHPNTVIRSATLSDENGWSRTFSGLPHTDSDERVIQYAVREANSPHFYGMSIEKDITTYTDCWVFTDASGISANKSVLIGNGNGQVLASNGSAFTVHEMDTAVNIIKILKADNENVSDLLWTVEYEKNTDQSHFFLKNSSGKYLSINGTIHTENSKDSASLFYLNASGDLQDARSDYRLAATNNGFTVQDRKAGNETHESADNVSLYIKRESETTAYTFDLTNTFLDPAICIQKTDVQGTPLSGAKLQILDGQNEVVEWTSDGTPREIEIRQAEYHAQGTLKLSTSTEEYVYTLKETASPDGYHALKESIQFKVTLEGESICVYVKDGNAWTRQSIYAYNEETKKWVLAQDSEHLTFVNTYDTGALAISKTVNGDVLNATDTFTFEVQLTNSKYIIAGQYTYTVNGGAAKALTLVNGKGTITLKDGETATITGLPIGTAYTVTESSHPGYIVSPDTPISGTIANNNSTYSAEFVNTPSRISIRKVTEGLRNSDKPDSVTVVFAQNGAEVASTALTPDADFISIPLTPGTYAVTESGHVVDGYQLVSSVLTDASGNALQMDAANLENGGEYTLTNTYAQGSLELHKIVVGQAPSYGFEFVITFTFDGKPLDDDYLAYEITGSAGTTTGQLGADGKVTLKAGDTITFPTLPIGTSYTIHETPDEKYTQISPDGDATGTIAGTERVSVTFTNRAFYPTLSVEKLIAGNDASESDVFSFLVKLAEGTTAITSDLSCTLDSDLVNGSYQTLLYDQAKGGYVLKLKGGEKATIINLTPGWTYEVEELNPNSNNYTLVSQVKQSGTLPNDTAATSFTNIRNAVLIKKEAVGLSGGDTVSPEFYVNGTSIGQLTSGGDSYKYYVTPGSSCTVTETGTAVYGYTFVSAVITGTDGLPVTNENGMGFTFPAEGMTVIPTVVVTNTYTPVKGSLNISKTVVGDDAAKAEEFTFTVQLANSKHGLASSYPYTVNGAEHTLTLNGGQGTIKLKHGETATITGLPIGTAYTVTETAAEGFITDPSVAQTGTIMQEDGSYIAAFTNTRTSIQIKKVTVGLANGDMPSSIDVSLNGTDSATVGLVPNAAAYTTVYITPGTYAVTESDHEVSGYRLVSSVLTDASGNALQMDAANLENGGEYTLTNTYEQGSLELSKSVADEDRGAEFIFDITFTPALDDAYRVYSINNGDSQTFDGSTVQVTLGHLDKVFFPKLPIGTKYTITETPDTGYQQVSPEGNQSATGTIDTNDENSLNAEVLFVNTHVSLIPALVVEKEIGGNAASSDDEFNFVVMFWEDESKVTPITRDLSFTYSTDPSDAGFKPISYNEELNGYPITLKGGQKATFVSLTEGWHYEVYELDNDLKYILVSAHPATGELPEISSTAVFRNEKNLLSLVKTVSGLKDNDTVAPSVVITDADGEEVFSGTLTPGAAQELYLPSGTYTLTESGCDMSALHYAWKSATLSGGVNVTTGVVSKDADSASFTFTIDQNISGAIALTLNNVYELKTNDLAISKTLENAGSDNATFTFTVKLENSTHTLASTYPYTVGGSEYTLTLDANGTGSITLTHGQTAVITGLPYGTEYTVTEAAKDGYTLVSKTGDTGTIGAGEAAAAFTNRRTSIQIRKTVTAPEGANLQIDSVTVTFTRAGESTPAATVTLIPGEDYITLDLPDGEYTVTETGHGVTGYTCTSTLTVENGAQYTMADSNSGKTANDVNVSDGQKYTVSNAYANGSLELSKTVTGGEADKRFTFTIEFTHDEMTLTDEHLKYEFGGETHTLPADGKITLGNGESVYFPNLPIGTKYTITETPDNGYQQVTPGGGRSASGTVETSTKVEVLFTNTSITRIPALVVTKSVQGNAASTEDSFNFLVTFKDGNSPVTSALDYSLSTDSPEQGFRTLTYDSAKGGYPLTLKHGETATFVSLTQGWTYSVVEETDGAAQQGYVLVSSENAQGTIPAISATASFVNERNIVEIRKVTRGLPDGTTVSPTISVGGTSLGAVLADSDQVLTAYVERGQSYALTESGYAVNGFEFAGAELASNPAMTITGADGEFSFTFPGDGMTNVPVLTITNTYTSDLAIEKKIAGNADSGDTEFPITVTLTHNGTALAGSFPYTITGDSTDYTIASGGTIVLKGGQTATITGLPYGAAYALSEGTVSGYTQVDAQNVSGTIAAMGQQKGVFTNAPISGLSIRKAIADGLSSGDQEFTFDIQLSHASIKLQNSYPYTVGSDSRTLTLDSEGNGVITLKGGETAVFSGLPIGTSYTITEQPADGYLQISSENTEGSITAAGMEALFTNRPDDFSLSITKEITGNAADATDEFTMTVTLTDASGTVLAGSYPCTITGDPTAHTIVSGGTITLKGGQTAVITGLPNGTVFTVEESDPAAKHYVLSLTDAANSDETATANGLGLTGSISLANEDVLFINERNAVKIQKTAEGLLGTDTVSPAVSVNGTSIGNLVSGGESITLYLQPGTHSLTESSFEKDGYTFVSATLTATNGVEVGQAGAETGSFTFTLADGLTTIPVLTIHNVYEVRTGSLAISKTIAGNAASDADSFTFTISLTRGGQPLTGSYPVAIWQGETQQSSSTLTFGADGKATVSLTGGQRAVISSLPFGAAYSIVEAPASGYVQTSATGATGTIAEETEYAAEFVNTKDVFSSLTVTKTIVGENPSTTDSFTFTVRLTNPDGSPVSGEFTCTGLTAGKLTFNANGETSFTLGHGQSVVISGLPFGTAYTVTEQEHRDYEMNHASGDTGVIDADGETAAFQNTHASNLPSLTVSKAIEGNAASKEHAFSFTITLKDSQNRPLTGSYHYTKTTAAGSSNEVLTLDSNGSAQLTLKAEESITLIKLPVGASYTVTENVDPSMGYTVSEPVASGVIATATTSASVPFINVKHTALSIVKTASSTPELPSFPAPMVSLYQVDTDGNKVGNALATVQLTANGSAVPLNVELEPNVRYLIEESGHTIEDFDVAAQLSVDGKPVDGLIFTVEPGAQTIALSLNNTYTGLYGPLTISKTVTGAGDESDSFEFTVTLTDSEGNPLQGSYDYSGTSDGGQAISGTIANGGTVTLMDGGSITIIKLPIGTQYTVTEEENLLYKPNQKTSSGEIDHDGEEAAFVNTYYSILPALMVTKQVQGNAASTEDTFSFTVTLTDKTSGEPLSGSISCLNEKDEASTITLDATGSHTFSLAHGESVTFIKLPVNADFIISEASGLNGYTLVSSENASGSIIDDQTFISSIFVNERNAEAVIAKESTGLLSGSYPAPTVSIYREGDMLTPVWSDTLTPNAPAVEIGQMPAGNYILVESAVPVNGYSCEAVLTVNGVDLSGDPFDGISFEVASTQATLILQLTNTYTPNDIPLEISKHASGLAQGYAYPAPVVSIFAAGDPLTLVWNGTLTPNGDAQELNLQPGEYILVEQNADVLDHSCVFILYVDGVAAPNNTFTLVPGMESVSLVLDNTYAAEFSTLTLSKTVNGGDTWSRDAFTFVFTLTDDAGAPIAASFPYTGTVDGTQPISGVVTNGSTVSLRHGGSISVKLPLNIHYKVAELAQDGYVLVSATGAEGVITPDGAAAAFVNQRQYSVTVSKEWVGNPAAGHPDAIRVQLLLNGTPIGDPVTLNAENGWQHTFTGLNASGPYSVVELDVPDGYVSRVDEIQKNVFVITNSLISIPPTGDDSPLELYLFTMLASAALLCVFLRRRVRA